VLKDNVDRRTTWYS